MAQQSLDCRADPLEIFYPEDAVIFHIKVLFFAFSAYGTTTIQFLAEFLSCFHHTLYNNSSDQRTNFLAANVQ